MASQPGAAAAFVIAPSSAGRGAVRAFELRAAVRGGAVVRCVQAAAYVVALVRRAVKPREDRSQEQSVAGGGAIDADRTQLAYHVT